MTTFYADLHIHSRFSRATSSRLTLPHLAAWAMTKGLSVLSTGDFTHPEWRSELRRDLVRDETSGLYRLRDELPLDEALTGGRLPRGVPGEGPEGRGPLFLLQAEISSIYKKDGAVRKVHNLVYFPDLDSADRFSRKLEAIGNLASDGRPILGLDSRNLLEIVLETDERGVLIPAHIWTPWFSLFGSKSGFNRLDACFGDLSEHVFALETGLSSDPEMNRLWSHLDRFALISNSDAHSGENLAREANVFSGAPSYHGLFDALRRSAAGLGNDGDEAASCRFAGTLEFFPEEGKYHLDGHRACNVVLEPGESQRLGNLCPVCGKPLTVGVLHRVVELADRQQPAAVGAGFHSLVPLPELIGECLGVGSKSRKVAERYAEVLQHFGSELAVLQEVPESDLRTFWDTLGEAVARMRAGKVIRQGGYDGEYGVVRVFEPEERADVASGRLGSAGLGRAGSGGAPAPRRGRPATKKGAVAEAAMPLLDALGAFAAVRREQAVQEDGTLPQDGGAAALRPQTAGSAPEERPGEGSVVWTEAQQTALNAGPHPVLVLAGPGSGKTRTLVGRLVRLLEQGLDPQSVAAVTFTRRAAGELRERLAAALASPGADAKGAGRDLPPTDTLHALALSRWPEGRQPAVLSEESAWNLFVMANAGETAAVLREAWARLGVGRERLAKPDEALAPMLERYAALKTRRQAADYTDLLEQWLERLRKGEDRPGWQHLLVDEVQDLSPLQLALLQALLPPDGQGFFGIGDPDQAIYGFRGAQPDVENALRGCWPSLGVITLRESYRSAPGILASASALLGTASTCGQLTPVRRLPAALHLFGAPTAQQEAAWVAERISRLLGGTSHTLADSRRGTDRHEDLLASPCSPGDIAVLVRLRQLMPPLREALDKRGIPCAVPEADPFWTESRVQFLLALAGRRHGRPAAQPVPDPSSLPAGVWADGPVALVRHLETTPPFDAFFKDTKAFQDLCKAWKTHGGWHGLLDWLQTRQELDAVRAVGEQVQIMTLHASKGLEFRAIFLPALEEGLLPFAGPKGLAGGEAPEITPEALAEERRLLYVGLTRAEDAVFVSHAAERQIYGRTLRLRPSRYLADVAGLFEQRRLVRHSRVTSQQMSLLGE